MWRYFKCLYAVVGFSLFAELSVFPNREKQSKRAEADFKTGKKREEDGVKRGDDVGATAETRGKKKPKEGSRLPKVKYSLKEKTQSTH